MALFKPNKLFFLTVLLLSVVLYLDAAVFFNLSTLCKATDMDTMIYLDQENGRLTTPAIKSRQNRLHSAPGQYQYLYARTINVISHLLVHHFQISA